MNQGRFYEMAAIEMRKAGRLMEELVGRVEKNTEALEKVAECVDKNGDLSVSGNGGGFDIGGDVGVSGTIEVEGGVEVGIDDVVEVLGAPEKKVMVIKDTDPRNFRMLSFKVGNVEHLGFRVEEDHATLVVKLPGVCSHVFKGGLNVIEIARAVGCHVPEEVVLAMSRREALGIVDLSAHEKEQDWAWRLYEKMPPRKQRSDYSNSDSDKDESEDDVLAYPHVNFPPPEEPPQKIAVPECPELEDGDDFGYDEYDFPAIPSTQPDPPPREEESRKRAFPDEDDDEEAEEEKVPFSSTSEDDDDDDDDDEDEAMPSPEALFQDFMKSWREARSQRKSRKKPKRTKRKTSLLD